MAQPGCVQRSVRIPPQLAGYISGPITVKFAIRPNGQPDRFEVMGSVPDQRIASSIWQAIQGCRWVPGADAQGKPVSIWVILPVRFTSG
jgi:protein TonB